VESRAKSFHEGGELLGAANGRGKVRVQLPAGEPDEYIHEKIVFHFSGAQDTQGKRGKAGRIIRRDSFDA